MSAVAVPAEFQCFPSEWEVLPFLDAMDDKTAGNKKTKKSDYMESGSLPVIDQGEKAIAGYVADMTMQCNEKLPCILFGDHTRQFKYVDHPFALGADGVKVLVPREGFDMRFLIHYLRQLRLPNAGYSRHFKFLKDTFVPRPTLAEQERIAAILDKAGTIRRKRQQTIDLADEFLRSVFLETFGDPVVNPRSLDTGTIGQLLKLRSGNFLPAANMNKSGNHLVYGGNGVSGTHDEYMFDEPKIVIGRVGVYCGAIHRTAPKSWITDNALYVAKQHDGLMSAYLEWALRIANLNQFASQAAQPLISGSRVSDVKLLVPSIELQQKFDTVVGVWARLSSSLNDASKLDGDLYGSLSQRAFAGEL